MSKEAVARQYLTDFLENLGDFEYDPEQSWGDEEGNFILTDLFFSGLLEIRWDPGKHRPILHFLSERTQTE